MAKTKQTIEIDLDKLLKEQNKYLEDNEDQLRRKITITRTDFMRGKTAFMASDVMQMPIIFPKDMLLPTACTDGKSIMLGPRFWNELEPEERKFILFHEALHSMFGHTDIARKGEKVDGLWNIACDCFVNAAAVVSQIGKLPKDCIQSDYNGKVELTINGAKITIDECHKKTVEEIFSLFVKHAGKHPGKGKGDGKGNGTGGYSGVEVMDKNGNKIRPIDQHKLGEHTQDEKEARVHRLRSKVVDNKLKGNMPGFLAEMLDGLLEGKINWPVVLKNFISPEIKMFQTWKRPSRRSAAMEYDLPGKKKTGVIVSFYVDTSGSIGKTELEYFMGEVMNLLNQFPRGSVNATLNLHHMTVYSTQKIDQDFDVTKMKIESGGTSHKDVFKHAEANDVRVAIMLTDAYSDFPRETSLAKVLFLVVGNKEASKSIPAGLGEVINIDELSDD